MSRGYMTGVLLLLLVLPVLSRAVEQLPSLCSKYAPLYTTIEKDLSTWAPSGLTPELIEATVREHTAGYVQKGLAVGFYDGKAYVISSRRIKHDKLKGLGHHVAIFLTYLRAFLDLERRFGSSIPNVEVVFHTIDRPVRLKEAHGTNYPVLRFGKSTNHPDILVPNFHFYMKAYSRTFLDNIPAINEKYPWGEKKPQLFSRFTGYPRYVHPNDSATVRRGAGGAEICEYESTTTTICAVRDHLVEWARQYKPKLDISTGGHRPMTAHAGFKYLLHVDGQGLSSRLDQLLALGSLVLKEESGYYAYYHHLLQPNVHYVPVWVKGPEDILKAVEWAEAHDDEAKAAARAAQEFAQTYLTADARACYWLALLTQYGKTMSYKPSLADNRWSYVKPVQQFIDEDIGAVSEAIKSTVWEP